ncbi:hypothetical protein [Mesorhizobium sp. CN2-181]|uniref:hypothetical protein n=1 Tax=Mesorhizobium yinganensis TaxID=3157707 RepID=UPI0032B87E7A
MSLKYKSRRIPQIYDVRKLICDGVDEHGRPIRAFETLEEAKRESDHRSRVLARHGSNDLADTLARCRKNDRCGSMACPMCSRIRRINTACSVLQFLDGYDEDALSFVTLINPDDALPAGRLNEIVPKRFLARTRRQLLRLGFDKAQWFALAYFDCEWDEGWRLFQPHIHLVAFDVPASFWDRLVERHFGSHERVRVRKRAEPITSLPRTSNYLDKAFWLEKVRSGNPRDLKPRRPKRIGFPISIEVYEWLDRQSDCDLRCYIGAKSYRRMIMK